MSAQYVVTAGDTLSRISSSYGCSLSALTSLNLSITDPDLIKVGQTLQVPTARGGSARGGSMSSITSSSAAASLSLRAFSATPRTALKKNTNAATRTTTNARTLQVKKGDTLFAIAHANNLSVRQLQRANGLSSDTLSVGQVLSVTPPPKMPAAMKRLTSLAVADLPLARGWRRTTRRRLRDDEESKTPSNEVAVGGLDYSARKVFRLRGTKLALPNNGVFRTRQVQRSAYMAAQRRAANRNVLPFASPVAEGYSSFVSSPFGKRWGGHHDGVDIAADTGTPIIAARGGTVSYAGWRGGYGHFVEVAHDGGWSTRYAHCSHLVARKGAHIRTGQVIAHVGATGNCTGSHLHFETRKNGVAKDPMKFCGI